MSIRIKRYLRFNPNSFAAFLLIFAIEVAIAVFIKDKFIRPFVGDILVILLIFWFLKSFFKFAPLKIALGTLIFAYAIEIAQYFKFVTLLGLDNNAIATVVLGSTFDWLDIVAYTIGAAIALISERSPKKFHKQKP